MESPHWLLLLLLVPFTGPLLKLVARGALTVWAASVALKLLLVSRSVGITMTDLSLAGDLRDRLVLIERKIATEGALLCWRMVRLAEKARSEGMPPDDAQRIIARMECYRDANAISPTGCSFFAFTIPNDHPLCRRYPGEVERFNIQMRRLCRAWNWSQGWLWQIRKIES